MCHRWRVVANGGALLTPYIKQRLIDVLPNAIVVDGVGSSETGAQMHHMSTSGTVSTGTFNAGPDTFVAAEKPRIDPATGSRRNGLASLNGATYHWVTRATPLRRRPHFRGDRRRALRGTR